MSLETEIAKANATDIEEQPGDDFLEAPVQGSREAMAAPEGETRVSEPDRSPPADAAAAADDAPAPAEAAPASESGKPAEPVAPAAEPEKPATPTAKILGRFESEADAQRYLDASDQDRRALIAAVRELQGAVAGLTKGGAAADPAKAADPAAKPTPTRKLGELLVRVNLGDEDVTDEMLVDAMLPVLKAKGIDPETVQTRVLDALRQRDQVVSQEQEIQQHETAFYEAHPDLKALGPEARPHLHLITRQVVERLEPEARAGKYGTKQAYYQALFTGIAEAARSLFHLAPAAAGGAPATETRRPAGAAAAPATPRDRSGTFSEGGGGGRGASTALTGQDKELADVFG